MRISATIKTLEFDVKGAEKDFLAAAYHIMLRAADQFLQSAAPAVPIHTGMARGSFLNMMHLLRANGYGHGVFIPESPQAVASDGQPLRYFHVTVGRGSPRRAVRSSSSMPKTPETARSLSTEMDKILTLKGQQWQLAYETRVAHFNQNEYQRNWRAFAIGKQAMDAYLLSPANIKGALPNLMSYVKVSTLSSGRSNPYKQFHVRTQKKVK